MSTRPSQCPELVRHREAWTGAQLSCPWRSKIVSTPVGQSLTAGVGDVVLRAEGRENMPNIYWPGRPIRPHATDWLYDNSVRWDAGKQGRVAASGCDHPIRCYYDEQHTPDRPHPATVNNIRKCWWSASFSDGHNHWNGLHPAFLRQSMTIGIVDCELLTDVE
jgi:hypothetical protein